jgi:hypothetical protein
MKFLGDPKRREGSQQRNERHEKIARGLRHRQDARRWEGAADGTPSSEST